MQMAWGYAPPLIIEAAVHHHLFDHLDAGPHSVAELAAATGASERGLRAILDGLVGIQLLARSGDRYALTPESSAFLVSTKPAYHGAFFRHISSQLLPNWLTLSQAVRTGRPTERVNNESQGAEFFADFVESLFPLSYAAAQTLGEHLGIPRAKQPVSVLDIGAGSGVWGIALAQQSPLVRVRAVDWPRVLEVTQRVAKFHGVQDRLTVAPGDLLEADLGPPAPLLFAVNMLVHTEAGDTFTFAEMSAWLRETGFTQPRLLEVPAVSPLVLATRP
jgi:hypothetical protein